MEYLKSEKKKSSKKQIILRTVFEEIPKRLWEKFVVAAQISVDSQWAQLSNKQLEDLAKQLTQSVFKVSGKSTFKDEFVTAGGVDLKEINFKIFLIRHVMCLYIHLFPEIFPKKSPRSRNENAGRFRSKSFTS